MCSGGSQDLVDENGAVRGLDPHTAIGVLCFLPAIRISTYMQIGGRGIEKEVRGLYLECEGGKIMRE